MSQIIDQHKEDYDKVIEHLKTEISCIKTGRATPLIVENIQVNCYDSKMPIPQLASISVPEPKNIVIKPWDKTIIKEIEKAIVNADIGLNPVNEGDQIRITLPALTEEDRITLVKLLHQKLEKSRIAIRGVRDKIKEIILKMEKDKEIGEDERYREQKELDEFTSEYNEKIKEIGERKEEEINTI